MTKAEFETVMIARLGKIMEFIGLSIVTDGTNTDLNDPWDWANRNDDGTTDCLLDLGELRLTKNLIGNLMLVDVTAGPRKEAYDQLGKRLEAKKENLEGYIEATYGIGLGTLTTGLITLNFATHGDD